MDYKKIKEELKRIVGNARYFDKKTFETIMDDRRKADKIFKDGGNVQEFYKNSSTVKTRFYVENGPAYCELLSILYNV